MAKRKLIKNKPDLLGCHNNNNNNNKQKRKFNWKLEQSWACHK
jgi:hypothetical protein